MYDFDANQRCDRCMAQAYHRATKGSVDLLFCNHHHREAEDTLLLTGWEIESDVAAIDRLANPLDVSANA